MLDESMIGKVFSLETMSSVFAVDDMMIFLQHVIKEGARFMLKKRKLPIVVLQIIVWFYTHLYRLGWRCHSYAGQEDDSFFDIKAKLSARRVTKFMIVKDCLFHDILAGNASVMESHLKRCFDNNLTDDATLDDFRAEILIPLRAFDSTIKDWFRFLV